MFFEVSCTETDDVIADEKDAKGHWRGAHELRRQSERRRGDYPKWPGVDRLRLEIESAGDVFNRAGLVKWRARQCLAVGIDTDTMNATKLVDIATRLENPHSGKTEAKQTEADNVPVVVAKTDNRKATGKAGGRPRKAKRTPEESSVMRYRKANPGISFWEIDETLGLASGESAKIYEAVTRRERRNKTESADKTGQI